MRTASTLKNINAPCTRKQFLIGSSAAAVSLFCGRVLLQAQPGSSPSGPVPPATPESADNVPDFPEHHPQFNRAVAAALVATFVLLSIIQTTHANDTGKQVAPIVVQIQHADYAGDRVAMQKGYDDLKPFLEDKELASRIRYWRGFAQWRRAINGFNDSVDPNELEQDLKSALDEFKVAMEKDPTFVDAKVGTISCLGYLAFMSRKDQARAKELVGQIMPLVKEAIEVAPDNPRLIWVRGPILWNSPPERGGGQHKAIENYQRGLEVCSQIKASADPLEPSWGKPELMMSLAYCYLNTKAGDVNAAERYARDALEIVPYWHYVRDILLPQILDAKAKAQ